MPNQIDADDWLYRMVRIGQHSEGEVLSDAFEDTYDAQSFNLARISSPQATLEKFAAYPGTRKKCKKRTGDSDPTYLEMYDAGYRVAVCSVRMMTENDLTFKLEPNGDEYNSLTAHVNVIGAKHKAAILASEAYLLTKEEIQANICLLVSKSNKPS